ncbi:MULTISPECIES: rhodanese-like domain-containing protein [unclassified Oceanispirochaeta]|uniref:rhodanese-like domain-containing protein n=1 Tax=unclassified Oceanispirochaeta TaxID=2635722 RepID=UPI000E09875C|nr:MULTISPECIES: rhodanese-like domain-containing protein [unclassified Oceanispirochaeta]MBF9014242.1 rhodanese-like domain-containing protein [Oceanispirochaeta sp. M2]NPD71128.1 rhodanese-like domain-containing protein [Oceanispirochaeta sp. M1]RDG33522.1 rhodanese-like domain-containing protein [Oceanispirochaeta sp. M1]
MKKILVLFMALLVLPMAMFAEGQQDAPSNPVADAAAEYFADYPGSRIVPATKAFEAIDAGADVLILDIRQADVYAEGHLKGAVNVPWGPELAKAIDWLPDDQPIYVNCYTGQTAGQATAVLNIAGFNVSSIKYGWNLGIAKTEGFETYVETAANAAPEASGVRIDADIKAAAVDYFNNLKSDPATPNNIVAASKAMDIDGAVIVSIRSAEDYAKGHIEGAINIPFGENMQTSFDQLPMDKKVLVYCYSGQTAGQTVGVLRMMGYDAASIKSGMGTAGTGGSGWGNEGLPVVK